MIIITKVETIEVDSIDDIHEMYRYDPHSGIQVILNGEQPDMTSASVLTEVVRGNLYGECIGGVNVYTSLGVSDYSRRLLNLENSRFTEIESRLKLSDQSCQALRLKIENASGVSLIQRIKWVFKGVTI